MLLAQLKFIYSSIQVSHVLVLTVCCKIMKVVFQIFHLISEMPIGFTVHINPM
jgi:hypothetical protein